MGNLGVGREPVKPTVLVWGDPVFQPPSDVTTWAQALTLGGNGNVVTEEKHAREALVTEHTVEQGSNVVDHIRPEPQGLTLSFFVSNTPIKSADADFLPMTLDISPPGQVNADGTPSFFAGGVGSLIDKGLQAIGLAKGPPTHVTYTVLQFNGEADYAQAMLDQLTELQATGTLLQIFTPRQGYENMVIKSVTMTRDKGTGTGASFSVDFKQIRIVASQTVDAPLPTIIPPTPPANQGKKDTAKVPHEKLSMFFHNLEKNGNILNPL